MSNPFEKYFIATERQQTRLNNIPPKWDAPEAAFVPVNTSLEAQYPSVFKAYTPDPTLKSAGDLLVDAAASALKIPTIIGGVAVGAADLALSAASKPIEGYMRIGNALAPSLIPEPMDVGYGYIAKGLHDTIGYRPEEAKQAIDNAMFSDARKIQEKEYQSGYTAAEDKAFQDSWTKDYQTQYTDLQQSGATEQQLKDFSTGFDKQYQQAAMERADKYQTSWDKPLSENIDIIGHGFNNLLENPSLALGGAIESGGYLLPSMLVSRGVMALEKAANVAKIGRVAAAEMAGKSIGELAITRSPFLAAGVGEGSVSGLTVLEQMRSQTPDGIAGGKELLGALGVAASTGLIGAGFGKAASKLGIGDIDAAGLGRAASQVAAMKLPALARPVGAVAQEGAEEFAQTFGESIIPNVTMGKDPLEGLGQELPLGTMAGAIMGAGMNAPSLVTGGFSDISSGLGKVKDAASLKSFDTLSNPEHKNYNPAQAFNLQLKNLESNDETVRTQAEANVSKVEADLNTTRATVDEQIKNINTALKSMPPIAQMTDAQKLEVAALGKARTELTAKSDQLNEHLIAFYEAQVTAQDHRDTKQGTQFTEEQAKADIATLTSTEGIDPNAQQEALNRVTRHFSKYSNDDLDLLASSPILTEAQRNSLRQLSKSKRELAAVQDPSQVFDNILNGYTGKTIQESHRGLNQYTDMVNTAVATKNPQLASLALDGLGAFTDDHTAKRDTINEAFGLVQNGTYAEVHALRTQEGTWGLVPFTAEEVKAGKNAAGADYLSKEALNKVGGFNVHINSNKNGAITQINNETQLIQDRFDALSSVAESFVGVTPKPVDTSIGRVDLILPIGTSGSGKSTWIKSINQNKQFVVISPDEMRVEFTGDMNDKSKDKEIYEEAAKRTVQAIREGKQVVFDTTNLTKDKRRPFIEAVKKAVPNANIQYKLMPLNPDLAKQRIKADIQAGVNRANVSDATIDRHTEAYKQMLEDIKDEPITPFISNATTVDTSTTPVSAAPPTIVETSQRSPKLEEAYKETFSKPIENWDANDFASVGAQATHIDPTFDSKTVDADNAFSQKMAKKIIADGIAKNRSTADIMQDVMFVAYSSDFAMKSSGVDALRAYIELRKAHGTSVAPTVATPIITEPKIKIGETVTRESKSGKYTVKSTKVSELTNLVTIIHNESGETTKHQYVTTYENVYSKDGDVFDIKIYRDASNPAVITDFKLSSKDNKFGGHSFGKQGTQTDKKVIDGFVENDAEYTSTFNKKFEGSLPVVTEPSDTTATVNNPVPEAPVQSVTPNTPATPTETKPPVNVWAGSNENVGLSNLTTRPFTFGTKKYQSVEHAYQTLKSGSFDQQTYDKYAGTENKKIAGNRGTKTTDNANVRLMEKLMAASFEQNKDAMALLEKTGDAVITHTQEKSIWGKEFPRILMEIREKNKGKTSTPSQDTDVIAEVLENEDEVEESARIQFGRLGRVLSNFPYDNLDKVPLGEFQAKYEDAHERAKAAGKANEDAFIAAFKEVEDYLKKRETENSPSQNTSAVTDLTNEVKEYGYLGELLEDEDVEKVVKTVIEKVLEDKADKSNKGRLSSYARFVEFFISHGFIEYFTKQAKNDSSIIKLTKDFNKLRDLARMPKHLKVLEDYVDSQNNDDLRAYLNKYPELKSIFSELKVKNPAKGTRGLALDVIADLTRVQNLLRTEGGKLVQLIGLMYIQAAFTKGQQYLIDTNYADLNSVLFPNTLSLLSTNDIGYLSKGKVLGDDAVVRRESLTSTELAFLDKVDGIPVGELPKEAFEIVKALVQNAVNAAFNSYEVVNYPRDEAKISSDIVHNIIVEHLPKEGFELENFTPEEVINGAVPESFIWESSKQDTPAVIEDANQIPVQSSETLNPKVQESIYSQLPSKTVSGNVVKQSWTNLKAATKAIYNKGIISTRIPNTGEHFGNPYSSDAKVLAKNPQLIRTNSTKESVEKYIDWVINSQDKRAKWIREQLESGNLKGKPIFYYAELNEPSHANALDYLINQYDWGKQIPVETELKAALQGYTNHSGGAIGADTVWGEEGAKAGVISNHYRSGGMRTVDGSVTLSSNDVEEGKVEAAKAAKRNWGYGLPTMKMDELIRNWAQVKYADAIFAIGTIVAVGEKVFPNKPNDTRKALVPSVAGGTGYAVGMAINHNKPVYVYNQAANTSYPQGWFLWDAKANNFLPVETPTLTKNFAGIGTRQINQAGKDAITSVYANTVASNTKAEPKVKDTDTTPPVSEDEKVTFEEEEEISVEGQEQPVATEDAKITVLQGVTDEIAAAERKKPFNLRNILKGYFTQSTTKEDATGANPLVTVKDFLSNFDVRTQVGKWLNDRRKPTEKQLEQVEHFKKFRAEFAKALTFVFNTQASAIFVSNKENLVGYMEMGKKASTRELDANVVTALALSAYSYLIKQGNKVMNTNEELETLFRFKKGMRAPLHIEQMFRFAGQEMPVVVKALGTDAAKALGLKVREDQDPTLQDRLNTSLGILAMEAMANAGFIVIDTLEDNPKDETDTPLTDFLTAIKTVRESKAHTIEDEYDFEVDTDAETQIKKFTMVRPNAKMEGIGNSVFEKGIIETEVDGKIVRTETLTLNRPVLTGGLPTLNSSLVNELIEANKETKGFLSYLFGVDVGYTMPLKEMPKKFFQKLINGTDASVPSAQVALLTEAQKHSFTMRTNTVAVFAAMQKLGENSQFLKEVLGIWIDDHVLSRTHVTERDSLQAKAQNDWTAVLNGLEWADDTLDENGQYQEFYDTQFVAQNQRQHLNSNMFSAQSSQIHRAMAALTGFSTTIDLSQDEQGTVKDEALLNLFYQAVGEGLEGLDDYLKADILSKAEAGLHQFFTVDKVYGDYYVPALKAFLETTESKNAIEAMRALIETGTIDTTQQKAIAAFVDKGGMGAQSLQSLIALAELDIAQANGTTFTTTIGFGSDGVNHGVSAANMLTGVISKDMRQQTGIFPIAEKGEDQIDNMQEVYRRKITDYYVDFGKVMAAKLRDLIPTFVGKLNTDFVEGMQALFPKFEALDDTGELKNLLAMRKMAKIWAIPFNYSAGKAALQRALARGFLAGIYGNMNKLANEALDIIDAGRKEGVTEEEKVALRLKLETVKLKTKTLEDNLNKVLRKYGMSVTLPAPQLLNEEAQGKLSSELESTLMQAAIDLHGEAAWQATEEFAKEYLQVRNVYTEVEKASFTLFDVVRNQLIEEKKASRKYTNVNAKVQVKRETVQYTAEELNAQEAEYFGLTTVEMAEVDAVLAAMRPMFNTALSIGSESTNAADSVTNPSGVSVRKHKMQREPAKGLRAVNTFYGKPRAESRNIGLTKEVEENAGVASLANAIQSMDAYVATKIQGFMNALDVHDAAVFGLKDFLKGTKKQNEEHLKALTNYQLGLEHAKMLVKVYQGYKAFMATQEEALKSEDVKVKENAQKLITKAKKQMEVLLWGEQMFKGDTALKINGETVYKGGLIPKLQAANVNIKDDAEIEEAISAFINYALKQDLQKLEVLLDTYSIHQFAGEGGMHKLTKADKASIEKQKALVQKALLDLGTELKDKAAPMNTTEAVKPTTELAKFLRKAKGAVIDITSLIEHLINNTDIADPKARAAQLEVLKAITPLIDKATKVVYSEGAYDGYGYYDEKTNTLHINSAKEAEGGVRSTLAVHELLHAALSRRIKTLNASIETKEAEGKKTGKEVSFSPAEVALQNLEKLRVNLVTPDGMRMLELQAELGSAIEDSAKFYKETEALYESQISENVSTIKELQALNKEEARRIEIEGEIKKRGTGIGAAYKAQLEAELKTLTPKAELDTKRNALLTKQQAMRDTKALLDKANKYFGLRETLSKKVLSERTRKDGSSSKFTQLNLVDMLTNIDEFISYGLTESRLQEAMKSTQVDRGGRTFSVKLRKFVEFVGQILGFRTHQISALAAFASDTAALLETIGSVTPVVAPNNGERLFSTQSAEDLVNGQSSLDIMTALPHNNTGAFNQQLDRLIVEEIGQLYNQDDAAKARIDEIQTLTASDALNAGFTLSRKEQYVQQALQYAVAAYMKLHAGGANVGQLRRVYHAAKAKMDVTGKDFHEGDWATATQQEKDAAKAKYDFLFDSTKEGYMDRFVSMALASESVSKILDIALPLNKPETQDKTWFETVSDWVSYVMAWLTNKYVRLNPIAGASNQLVQLMDNLVKLDIRNRQEGVALHQKAWNSIGLVTTPLNNLIKKGQDAALKGEGLRNSRYLPVRALGAAIVLRSEEAAKVIPQLILDMRNNQLPHTKLGEAANILMEAASAGSMRNAFDVLTRQTNLNAKNRQDIVDNVKKAVNAWFKTPLTKLQHKAVTYGLLRTDAQALLENYSVEDIVDMVLHEGKLNAEIAKLKKEIAKNPNGNDMLNAAEQLGYYMVTRIGGEGLVKNALGISIGLGTQYFTSVEEADPKLVNQLNTLVSMLAMTHVSNADKGILASIYKTDAEGIHATIQLHSGLVNDSMKDFQENPLNMVKGWMPEITNPFIEIKTADSMTQREQMESEGWVFIGELKRDAMDKGAPKYLMKHNDFGYQRLVSGAVDLQRTARSGTEAIDRTNPKYLAITQARYRNAANRASIPNKDFDPSKQQRGLIAAYDTDGVVLGYNYEMDSETRDAHLDRKHNIGELLGTMGGLNYYKPAKKKQSNAVAQVLFDDYRENYSQNPNAYIKLSHKSSDPKVVEMWRMLPQDFKDQATALYGKGNPIIIRNEAFNMAFGFKKFSVVSYAFDTKAADRNKFQSGFVGFAEATSKFKSGVMGTFGGTNGSTARADFAKAEHVVQEIVKAIKDFIVIRSGTTMFWNIFANVLMLMANGINPFTIVKDWVFAVTNVRAYQNLNSQLIQAQADLVAGKDPTALKQKIGALKAELKANPLSEYINAGLLSSIVEDVNIQSGDYTYVSAFKQSVDEKTQWIPKPVKTFAKVATIAPSTKLYQFLATTTQLSDFVAKYSMSKHLQSKGVSKSESIVEASQTFINYDVPTSQGLQYANDMGLFMFTKFFLRIQAVLMKLLGKRAGSAIAQHLLVENLTGAEGILSPMMIGHIGNNPIESSVFGLPSAFFSIGTVDAVTGLGSSF